MLGMCAKEGCKAMEEMNEICEESRPKHQRSPRQKMSRRKRNAFSFVASSLFLLYRLRQCISKQ